MPDWNTLLVELDEHEPSFTLIQEAQNRAAWRSSPSQPPSRWRSRFKLGIGIALGMAVVAGVLLVLALAAHSRTSVTPAHSGPVKRPPVAPVRLDVRNGAIAVFGNMNGVRQMSASGGPGAFTVHCHGCDSVAGADWSGDGTLLAYSASCAFGGCGLKVPSNGIRVLDSTAGTDRLIVQGDHLAPLSLSADGRWIVYADTHWIRVVPTDGSRPPTTIITSLLDVVTTPTWSPDGKWIAYVKGERVYTAGANGQNRARLAAGYAAAWSPDGRWIAYVGHGLHLVAPDGTGDHMLSWPGLKASLLSDNGTAELAWSPDGRQLALTIGNGVVIVSARTGAVIRRVTLAPSGFWYPTGLVWRPRR
jgi:WD40-like Beta Propeller Repeat